MRKILQFVKNHKIIFGLIIIALAFGGYYIIKAAAGGKTEIRYVLAAAERGTLINSITGSGQIAASNQADAKAKASGDVLYVAVKQGQEVKAGAILVSLNAKDALKAVRDAQSNLTSAKLSLNKLKKAADPLSVLQAENDLEQSREAKVTAQSDLDKSYDDGYNDVAAAFLDLPATMTGLEDMIYGKTFDATKSNINWYLEQSAQYDYANYPKYVSYKNDAVNSYDKARIDFNTTFDAYKLSSRVSSTSTLENIIFETYETAKLIADAVKNMNDFVDAAQNAMIQAQSQIRITIPAAVSTHQTSLDSFTAKVNNQLANLLSAKQAIDSAKNSIVSADRAITEKTLSLADLKGGADPLDIKSQELAVAQRVNALTDAREKLADYAVRAPFDGVVASVTVKKGDSLSAGVAAATLITKQKLAEISLNEVDAAKVKPSQKTTLTFDAIEGLNMTGKVAEIDALGTVTQGVVTYNVKIVFDTQDKQVKPGMSVSASIITDVKQDVLLIPSAAVKTQGDASYVEILDGVSQAGGNQGVISAAPPRRQNVETGISNDTSIEIISGLKEGDLVVSRTITQTAAAPSQQAPSLFGGGGNRGAGGAGGGTFRMQTR
ncbi:efflux RND transporter periplasmic adaptor subunit [Patescibacteria group bacterium]|nr:MAG: efflux RND transporter periplasmic adaptor subunit [Patescibacteria group bacterium]